MGHIVLMLIRLYLPPEFSEKQAMEISQHSAGTMASPLRSQKK
ncbi:hypothetical protein ExPECSC078_04605 [Escherichia coli]|nr:hypothetical protein ExPECSC078_04605 [Escherichia coli]